MAAWRRRQSIETTLAIQFARQMLRSPQGRKFLLATLVICGMVWACVFVWNTMLRPRHPVGPIVRIATWNLRQFSDRPNIDLRTIASIITTSHFDLLAIQEVKQDGEEVDRLLNTLGVPWRAASLSAITGNHERFAFIYNGDHVTEIGRPHFITTGQARVFDRTPYEQNFRAGHFDFTLITVHLSYGDIERRRTEAYTLSRYAKQLSQASTEKDVIVLGDFNEQGSGNLHYFSEIGWESLNTQPTNLSSTEIYDTLLIDPANTREWSGQSGAITYDESLFHNNDKAAMETVSDHRPAYADFVTNLPDDD